MSGKFASITAGLLARKGQALPSAIVAKPPLDWNTTFAPMAHADTGRNSPPIDTDAAPSHGRAAHHRDDAHYLRKIQVGLSDHDHERLRILSARKETSRQQIVRNALCAYFEKHARDYSGRCLCLKDAGFCQNDCPSS